mgnify:CR=1 FL=1
MAKKTSIGGMALLEGIMMIGPEKKSIAVRKPSMIREGFQYY